MKYATSNNPKLGTTINITCTPVIPGGGAPDSVKITIKDGGGTARITDTAMTNNGDGTYTYLFKSLTSYTSGVFKATITALSGDYPGVSEVNFTLEA
jgi:hypothetical protein